MQQLPLSDFLKEVERSTRLVSLATWAIMMTTTAAKIVLLVGLIYLAYSLVTDPEGTARSVRAFWDALAAGWST